VYQSNIIDALKKDGCPDNLIKIKQPSIFENTKQPDHTKTYSTDFNGYDQKKKPTDRPDGIDDSNGITNESGRSNQNNDSIPSTGQNDTKHLKHHLNNKKSPSKKDQYTHSNDWQKKKNSRRPGSNNKRDKYDPDDSSESFSSGETDNLEPGSLSSPFTLQPSYHNMTRIAMLISLAANNSIINKPEQIKLENSEINTLQNNLEKLNRSKRGFDLQLDPSPRFKKQMAIIGGDTLAATIGSAIVAGAACSFIPIIGTAACAGGAALGGFIGGGLISTSIASTV